MVTGMALLYLTGCEPGHSRDFHGLRPLTCEAHAG
jgi:hypothetical protein